MWSRAISTVFGLLSEAADCGLQDQEAGRIGNQKLAAPGTLSVAPVDSNRLDVVAQLFAAVNQAQVQRTGDALKLHDGLIFLNARDVRHEVQLNDVSIHVFLVAEA